MGKYLMLWQLDPARVPVDPKERANGWSSLMEGVNRDLERGVLKEWGAFPGEGRGFCIAEGSDTEVSIMTQRYSPYVRFETHPVMSNHQIEEMLRTLRG